MKNAALILILLLLVGAAGFYIYKAKKKGQKCIGCPDSGSCTRKGDCGGQNK